METNMILAKMLLGLSLLIPFQQASSTPTPPQIQPSVIESVHKSTLHIGQRTIVDGSVRCSATAIGPHAILTASHCEAASDKLFIEGFDDPLHIDKIERDEKDHSIYLLSGPAFSAFAPVDGYYAPKIGEHVFMIGNPGAWSGLYREGYVAGALDDDDDKTTLFVIAGWHGDSGAGVFNESGALIGVYGGRATQGDPTDEITFGYFYPLQFSNEQLYRAVSYAVKANASPLESPAFRRGEYQGAK